MQLWSETFAAQMSGYTFVESPGPNGTVTRTYTDAFGVFMGKSIAKVSGSQTTTQYFDAQMEFLGSQQATVSDRTVNSVYDSFGQHVFTVKVLEKSDYTLTETFGANWVSMGYVKEIHTATTKGVQTYGADDKLISAHLEINDGNGVTKVEDYGPDWVVIAKTTVTVKADFTLTETFGAGGVSLGSVKQIHTATTQGVQTYGPDGKLVSAHLESNDGLGVTKVEDYGPDWFLIAKTTVTTTAERVITEYQANGAGNVTGGIIMTAKADFTLTETFGAGWTLLGYVKEVHTATTHGVQTYGADDKLISAHLESDNGLGVTKVEDYGPDWFLLAKTTVTTTPDRVVTEHQANGAGNVTGGSIVTTTADATVTETFGVGWTLLGYVKEVHTATTTGVQTYGADEKLISAHLESDDGHGVTKVEDYGPDWFLLAKTTVTTTTDRVITEHQANGAGNVTGGSIVTTTADATVTETFGAGWTLLGFVKEIHTATTTGVQTYGADEKLSSAHLESDDGHGVTKVEDYGPDWFLLAKTTVTTTADRVITEHQANGAGNVTGGSIVTTTADATITETFGAGWTLLGYVKEVHTATTTGVQTYGADDKLISAHLESNDGLGVTKVEDYGADWSLISRTTVTVKADFTLTENLGAGGVLLGFVKQIHTADTHGVQNYGADGKLVSAHLESDNGLGVTKIEDYGPDWFLIAKTTVTTTAERVVTEHQANGAGNVTGGTIVTTKPDFTTTETFGAGWTLLGYVKEIHTATTKGVQTYGADDKLVSAHLESDNGLGVTKIEDYGANWFLIAKTVVTTTPERVITEHYANGAGNVTGGTIVTPKADFTLTETFGAGWTLLGSVKAIHTATTHGEQIYGADGKLISAHLEIDNGQGVTKIEEYGADWFLIERTVVTTTADKVYTEHQANGSGNVDWSTSKVGSDDTAVTKHNGSAIANAFVGDIGKDIMNGDAGNDHLYGMGNNDELNGGLGDDYLDGGAADDKLAGNEGNDTLVGGSGNDTLSGGAGMDILIGGLGRDILTGGGLSDSFVFKSVTELGNTAASRDQITDFQDGIDKIDFSAIDANGALAGDTAFQFIAAKGAAFSGTAGAIVWSQFDDTGMANDRTFIFGDINGDKVADFQIELYGLHNLTQGDFVL